MSIVNPSNPFDPLPFHQIQPDPDPAQLYLSLLMSLSRLHCGTNKTTCCTPHWSISRNTVQAFPSSLPVWPLHTLVLESQISVAIESNRSTTNQRTNWSSCLFNSTLSTTLTLAHWVSRLILGQWKWQWHCAHKLRVTGTSSPMRSSFRSCAVSCTQLTLPCLNSYPSVPRYRINHTSITVP